MTDHVPIRDATSVILLRDGKDGPSVLMGRRLSGAVFMPGKYVFPGGRVDPDDALVPVEGALHPVCRQRLAWRDTGPSPETLVAAGIRELWEETGLVLGAPGTWQDAPGDWASFAGTGHRPSATGLSFVFRALTPPGRPRRFDARFFLARADALASNPDDFSAASGELADLAWIPLDRTIALDLAIVTSEVLTSVSREVSQPGPPATVPYMMRDKERLEIPPSTP